MFVPSGVAPFTSCARDAQGRWDSWEDENHALTVSGFSTRVVVSCYDVSAGLIACLVLVNHSKAARWHSAVSFFIVLMIVLSHTYVSGRE